MSEEQKQEFRVLLNAREIALDYDHIPDSQDESYESVHNHVSGNPSYTGDLDITTLIMESYTGYSTNSIEDEIISKLEVVIK